LRIHTQRSACLTLCGSFKINDSNGEYAIYYDAVYKNITMISEPFAIGNSIIYRLDPRLRIVLTSIYSFVVALSMQFRVLIIALLLSVGILVVSKINLKTVARRVVIVNGLIFVIWLVLPLTFKGAVFAQIGPLTVYRPGVVLSAQITLKSNAILMAFIALIATMSFASLGHALHRLRVPDKIVHLLLMSYRYIFVIEKEYQRLLRAAKIRGFHPGTNVNTYRTYAYVIGMLFVRATNRAERVQQAMLCRGFKGKFHSLQEFQTSLESWIFSGLMAASIICLALMEWSKLI
jgi:cobalt/nickel transport system permease protein